MAGLIGKKIGMTRVFDEGGAAVPVTIVEAGPCPVLQIKNAETDGYTVVLVVACFKHASFLDQQIAVSGPWNPTLDEEEIPL